MSRRPITSAATSPVFAFSLVFLTTLVPICEGIRVDERATGEIASLHRAVSAGDYGGFSALANKSDFYSSSRNKLLFNLDTGLASLYDSDPGRASGMLAAVGDMNEEYYTKSISRDIAAILVNDLTLPYYGEDYEVTFAGNAAALAYAAAGETEDALVEVRRVEHRLAVMSDAYEGDGRYRDDAFSHYLAGILYEADGRIDDARVSYRLAQNAYGGRFFPGMPPGISRALDDLEDGGSSLFALPAAAGTPDSSSSWFGAIPGFIYPGVTGLFTPWRWLRPPPAPIPTPGKKRVMAVCAFTGPGPVKEESVINAHFTDDGVDYLIRIALPVLRSRIGSVRDVRLTVNGTTVPMDIAADYNHVGLNAFRDRSNAIFLRTLARVSARYLLVRAAKEKTVDSLSEDYEKAKEKYGEGSSEATGALLRLKGASLTLDMIANELLEHADTRCSLLIPGQARLARAVVSGDSARVAVEYLDARGGVVGREARKVATDCAAVVFTALR